MTPLAPLVTAFVRKQIRQVRALSNKRTEERLVNHLNREEMKAVLDVPDPGTSKGVHDQRCSILASPLDCVSRNSWVFVSTRLNSTARIPVFWCEEKPGGNAACHCGKKLRGRCGRGWPCAVTSLHPKSS
jgi:hypothetical protein